MNKENELQKKAKCFVTVITIVAAVTFQLVRNGIYTPGEATVLLAGLTTIFSATALVYTPLINIASQQNKVPTQPPAATEERLT